MKALGEFVDEALREIFEERAAIKEFDALMPREQAEKEAAEEIEAMRTGGV